MMPHPSPLLGDLAPHGGREVALGLPPGTLPLLVDLHRTQGDFFRLSASQSRSDIYVVAHPDLAREVLLTRHADYRRIMLEGRGSLFLGKGLLTNEGNDWKRHRRVLQPCFHGTAVPALLQHMDGCSAALVDRWRAHARACRTVDLRAEALDVSLEFNLRATFGADMPSLRESLHACFLPRLTATAREDTRSSLVFLQQVNHARRAISCLIADRRNRAQSPVDLLAMFMNVRHRDNGQGLPEQQIIDEILGVLVAGHETVAAALACIWFEISRRPEVQAVMREELDRVLADSEPSPAKLHLLVYTRQVILEALRLHPPIWVYTRQSLAASKIGPWTVPSGGYVFVCSYLIHRHGQFWEHAHAFDPDRFSAEDIARRHGLAYLPYSRGPRHCIGDDLSMSELLFHVAASLRAVGLEHVGGAPDHDNSGFLLRQRSPMAVKLMSRN